MIAESRAPLSCGMLISARGWLQPVVHHCPAEVLLLVLPQHYLLLSALCFNRT